MKTNSEAVPFIIYLYSVTLLIQQIHVVQLIEKH